MNTNPTRKPMLPTVPAKSDAEFQAGKRLYAEQWGDAVVTNTYLGITILAPPLLAPVRFHIATPRRKIDSFIQDISRFDARPELGSSSTILTTSRKKKRSNTS